MQTLDAALSYSMPKLLACCEYYIAADPSDKFGLPDLLRLGKSLPKHSALRIIAALREALKNCTSESADAIYAHAFYKMAQSSQQ